jgi:hypothetical protein
MFHKLTCHKQVALTFTVVALVSIVLFFAGQVSLYTPRERRE